MQRNISSSHNGMEIESKVNNPKRIKHFSSRELDPYVKGLFDEIQKYSVEKNKLVISRKLDQVQPLNQAAYLKIKQVIDNIKLELFNQEKDILEKINGKDQDGYTPLIEAAMNGLTRVVELLIAEGADLFARNKYDETALICAAWRGHKECIQLFINEYLKQHRAAEIDHQNLEGYTALMQTASRGYIDSIHLLLEAKVDPKKKNKYGESALILAAKNNHMKLLHSLTDVSDIDAQDNAGYTALNWAIMEFNPFYVNELIQANANVNIACTLEGNTPLMNAAMKGREVIKELIEAKAELNAKNNEGVTALMYAAASGSTNCLSTLIDAKADLNVQNEYGFTALMYAIISKKTECAKQLIAAGAKLELINFKNNSALHFAIQENNLTIIKFIFERVNSKDFLNYLRYFCVQQEKLRSASGSVSNMLLPDNYFEQIKRLVVIREVRANIPEKALTRIYEYAGLFNHAKNNFLKKSRESSEDKNDTYKNVSVF